MAVSLEYLASFVAAAECGSFSAAGRRLGKAQSAISSAVANLEIDTGVQLFARTGRYPELTTEGEVLLREARTILARCNDFMNRAYALSDKVDARIRIAIDEIIPTEFLVHVFTRFHKSFPATELEVLYGSLTDIETLVVEDRADLGVLAPFNTPGQAVVNRLLTYMSVSLVVAASHPLAEQANVEISDLAKHRQLVITSRGGEHEPDETIYSSCPWMLESTPLIHDLVRAGVGYSYLPNDLVASELQSGTLVKLDIAGDSISQQYPIYLIWEGGSLSGRARQWLVRELSQMRCG